MRRTCQSHSSSIYYPRFPLKGHNYSNKTETSRIKELIEFRCQITHKDGQKYIDDEIKQLLDEPPPYNPFFEFWNFVTCGQRKP